MKRFTATAFALAFAVAAAASCAQRAVGELPQLPPPAQPWPPTAAQIELGRKLFFDPRLSIDGTVSCATCHDPKHGWSDGLPRALGIRGQNGNRLRGDRNTPTIVNAAFSPLMFHDGRTIGMPTQSLQPILNPIEMGDQTEGQVLNRIASIPGYRAMFEAAYGSRTQTVRNGRRGGVRTIAASPVDRNRYGHAMAAFQSTVVSRDAPIDRRLRGDLDALSPAAERGFAIFQSAGCMACHVPPLWTDNGFHNNGMEVAGKRRATDGGRAALAGVSNVKPDGRSNVRAFKTPTLREIGRTAPYGHAGDFASLERVVRHYNAGGARFDGVIDPQMDRRIRPLGLDERQEADLVALLREGFLGYDYPHFETPELPR